MKYTLKLALLSLLVTIHSSNLFCAAADTSASSFKIEKEDFQKTKARLKRLRRELKELTGARELVIGNGELKELADGFETNIEATKLELKGILELKEQPKKPLIGRVVINKGGQLPPSSIKRLLGLIASYETPPTTTDLA